jgi:Tfp pilus assembly protein PilF
MTTNNRFKNAITSSVELEERGEHAAAMGRLDQVIAEAVTHGEIRWIRTLCHDAAIMCRFRENWASARDYYEQSLASDPENARALYGLAAIALDEGDPVTAREYAARCHTAILETEDEILKQALLDLIAKEWPDLVRT